MKLLKTYWGSKITLEECYKLHKEKGYTVLYRAGLICVYQ